MRSIRRFTRATSWALSSPARSTSARLRHASSSRFQVSTRAYDGLATAANADTRRRRGRAKSEFMSPPASSPGAASVHFVSIAGENEIMPGTVIFARHPGGLAGAGHGADRPPLADAVSLAMSTRLGQRCRSLFLPSLFTTPPLLRFPGEVRPPAEHRQLPPRRGQIRYIAERPDHGLGQAHEGGHHRQQRLQRLGRRADRADPAGHDEAFDRVIQPGTNAQRIDRERRRDDGQPIGGAYHSAQDHRCSQEGGDDDAQLEAGHEGGPWFSGVPAALERTARAAARICGVTNMTCPSTPLTKLGESSVESSLASRTASSTATGCGTSSAYSSSHTATRNTARSTAGSRSSVQPCRCELIRSSICAACSLTPRATVAV